MFFQGEIIENQLISDTHYLMKIKTPSLAPFTPGQFVMIRGWQGTDPLLPRPFAIYSWEGSAGEYVLQIVYKIVGRGTVILSGLHKGDPVHVNGPLGNGFELPAGVDRVILAGGGIGFSSVFPVALHLKKIGTKMDIILGAKSSKDIPPASSVGAKSIEGDVTYTTEDGSMGKAGLVTEILQDMVEEIEDRERARSTIFACGPSSMLKVVQGISSANMVSAFLSLENFMACGFGVCLGCVVKVTSTGGYDHVRVCKEGPVFDSKEVIFSD